MLENTMAVPVLEDMLHACKDENKSWKEVQSRRLMTKVTSCCPTNSLGTSDINEMVMEIGQREWRC